MKTKIGTLSSESLLAALILVTAAGCTHYWERPGGSIADFERDSAACIEDVRHSPFRSDSREQDLSRLHAGQRLETGRGLRCRRP